jgi:acyl-CoA thioester hydrolase
MSASAALASGAPLFVAPVTVRWRDLDAFNHVNNANYLTYIEEARLQWLMHVGDWFDDAAAPVLAASELNYRIPITWPTDIRVELRCERVGNSSLTLAYRIVDAVDATRVFSDGRAVMVWTNPATGKPVPLPDSVRTAAGAAHADRVERA